MPWLHITFVGLLDSLNAACVWLEGKQHCSHLSRETDLHRSEFLFIQRILWHTESPGSHDLLSASCSVVSSWVKSKSLSKLRYHLHSVQFSHSVVSNSLQPHELQHTRLPCPSPTPKACSNSCPSNWWCHPTISSSVVPLSSCIQSFPASGSFQMSQFFTSDSQSIGTSASASVLPMNIQDWFPLGLTGLISLQPKGLSRVFSNTTVQKHQFFGIQLSF